MLECEFHHSDYQTTLEVINILMTAAEHITKVIHELGNCSFTYSARHPLKQVQLREKGTTMFEGGGDQTLCGFLAREKCEVDEDMDVKDFGVIGMQWFVNT